MEFVIVVQMMKMSKQCLSSTRVFLKTVNKSLNTESNSNGGD